MRQAPAFGPGQQQEVAMDPLDFLPPARLPVSLCRTFRRCCKHSYRMAICLQGNDWLAHPTFLQSPKRHLRAPVLSQRLIIPGR